MNLIALAPKYFVFQSWEVVTLFLEFVVVPIVAVAVLRHVISIKNGMLISIGLLLVLCAIAPSLYSIMMPGALSYWGRWCAALLMLSLTGSLLLLREERRRTKPTPS